VEKIAGFAAQLSVFGVVAGSRIGLSCPNSVNYVALTYAVWSVNAVVVPIPVEFTAEESAQLAETLSLAAVISHQPRHGSLPLAEVFFTRLNPSEPADNHGLNLAFIRFTSGTTSARKGVALSHESIRDRVAATNKTLGIRADDTVMWCLPMSHHFLATLVLYLNVGATVVLARHVFARPFLDAVNRWRGTVLYAAPFHYALLARDASGTNLDSVRLAVSTTCSLPQEVAGNFQARFNLRLTQALGVIELGLICVNDDPVGRWDSAGRPQPDYAVHIRNPDADGNGEVVFAGPGFFDAYANPWTLREQLMPDGWFATGDLGRVDAQGYLYLAGRKASVINLAGRKVFPEEIEAVLNRHPAVGESRVYGATHAHLGEVVEAEIVLRVTVESETLRDFCRTRLSADKIPSRFTFVSAIEKTAVTGKIRRPAATTPTA
jgi:long-chain acyl-CoA synthetase